MSAMAALVLVLAAGECGRRRRRGSSSQHLDMAPTLTTPSRGDGVALYWERVRSVACARPGPGCAGVLINYEWQHLQYCSGYPSSGRWRVGGQGEVGTRYHDIIVLRPVIQFIDICNIHQQGSQEPQRSSTLYTTLLFSLLSYCSDLMLLEDSIHCIKIKDILLINSIHFIY